jgi:hypothetical protein
VGSFRLRLAMSADNSAALALGKRDAPIQHRISGQLRQPGPARYCHLSSGARLRSTR